MGFGRHGRHPIPLAEAVLDRADPVFARTRLRPDDRAVSRVQTEAPMRRERSARDRDGRRSVNARRADGWNPSALGDLSRATHVSAAWSPLSSPARLGTDWSKRFSSPCPERVSFHWERNDSVAGSSLSGSRGLQAVRPPHGGRTHGTPPGDSLKNLSDTVA